MATAYYRHLTQALKIVLVGDAEVGKTWLVCRARELYATLHDGCSLSTVPFDPAMVYSPTAFDTCFTNVDTAHLGNYQTNIWDTGGSAAFNFVRPLAYICADVFMLCFDLSNRESLCNVTERWLPELEKYQLDTPIVLVGTKSDLRDENERSESNDFVSFCEARDIAKKLGALYHETSAQSGEHVSDAFVTAVKLGHGKRNEASQSQRRSKIVDSGFDPTWIPPMSSPPEMKTEPSTYITDFKKIMDDNGNADILFKFEDGSQGISAHKIVLWLTSSIFRDVLQDQSMSDIEYYKDLFEVIEFSDDPQPSLDDLVDLKTCVRARTCIVLKNWISQEIFVKILEFCYTGEAGISKDTEQSTIKELLTASEKLKVQSLAAICSYFLKPIDPKKDDNQQNLTDSSHAKKKLAQPTSPPRDVLGLFLDKEASVFSDLTFRVDDTLVYAHKAILVARSPVLAALLSENFLDGKSSQVQLHGIDCQSFLAVLEYLYTDHCSSIETTSVENVLILADRLCLNRLVQICEIHICKELQQVVTQTFSTVAHGALDALAFSKMFNAKQLTEWCLFFLAVNLTSFQGTGKELASVVKENKQFFEEHSWPPQDYLQALEKYKRGAWGITAARRKLHRKTHSCLPHECTIL